MEGYLMTGDADYLLRVVVADSLGTDQDKELLPVGVQAPDHQPEEPVSALEVRARTAEQAR